MVRITATAVLSAVVLGISGAQSLSTCSEVSFHGLLNCSRMHLPGGQLGAGQVADYFTHGPYAAVDLSQSGITTIVPRVFENLTTGLLDLSQNDIERLRADTFAGIQVTILDLSGNAITHIEPGAFNELVLSELNLVNNQLSVVATGVFSGLTTTTLDLGSNMIADMATNAWWGLNVSSLYMSANNLTVLDASVFHRLTAMRVDLHNNAITAIRDDTFLGITLEQLVLAENDLVDLFPWSFRGLFTSVLDLRENSVEQVMQDAFSGSTVRDLLMAGNPSTCEVTAGGNGTSIVMCDCAQNRTRRSSICVQCPSTLLVTNVSWYHVVTAAALNLTTADSVEESLGSVTEELTFSCAGGARDGDTCVIPCRAGFEGVPVTYECAADSGRWHSLSNQTLPACVQFALPIVDTNATFSYVNSTAFEDNTSAPVEFDSATAGEPFYQPPPRAYGASLRYTATALPKGLTMHQNGQIVGVPEEAGNFSITIVAEDDYGNVVSDVTFVLVVAPALDVSDSRRMYCYKGWDCMYGDHIVVMGGRPPFTYTYVGTLPPGMHVDKVGPRPLLKGSPQQTGVWPGITITVHDAVGVSHTFPTVEVVVEDRGNGLNFRVQFFIALTVSVLLIMVSIYLVGRRYRKRVAAGVNKTMPFGKQSSSESPFLHKLVSAKKYADNTYLDPPVYERDCDRRRDQSMLLGALSREESTSNELLFVPGTVMSSASGDAVATCGTKVDSETPSSACVKVMTGTRIYRSDPTGSLDPAFLVPLETFLRKASFYSKHILVAAPLNDAVLCRAIEDLCSRLMTHHSDQAPVKLIRIPYWGRFTPPLNVLLRHASLCQEPLLLLQSVEVLADRSAISALLGFMDDATVCVGAALDDAHTFVPGRNVLTGLTSPWNTFAVWNVGKLGRTGFLPISDGVAPLSPDHAGVEEVAAIALLQTLFPHGADAKLVRLDAKDFVWDVDFKCKGRQRLHAQKMESKLRRPQQQISAMGEVTRGTVVHIDVLHKQSSAVAVVNSASVELQETSIL